MHVWSMLQAADAVLMIKKSPYLMWMTGCLTKIVYLEDFMEGRVNNISY